MEPKSIYRSMRGVTGLPRASLARGRSLWRHVTGQTVLSFGCVLLTVASDFVAYSIFLPVIPAYARRFAEEGGLPFELGTANSVLGASYALSQFLCTPLFGTYSDKLGRRPLFLVSLVGSVVGSVATACAWSFWSLVAFRFFAGLFSGTRPVAFAYIADIASPAQMPAYMSGLAMCVSLSLFLAPVLGGSLGVVDLRLPALFHALCSLCVLLLALRGLHEPPRSERKQEEAKLLRDTPGILVTALAGGLTMLLVSSWTMYFPIVADDLLGFDANAIGLVLGTSGLMIGVAQFAVFVPLAQRLSVPVVGALGALLSCAPLLLPAFPQRRLGALDPDDPPDRWFLLNATNQTNATLWAQDEALSAPATDLSAPFLLAMTFVLMFSCSLMLPGYPILMSHFVTPKSRGRWMGFFTTCQASARVLAPLCVGQLYDAAPEWPVWFVGGLGGVLVPLCLGLAARLRRRKRALQGLEDDVPREPCAPWSPDPEQVCTVDDVLSICSEARSHGQSLSWLRTQLDRMRQTLQQRKDLGEEPDPDPPAPLEERHALGLWVSEMLEAHGYSRWASHKDHWRTMMMNAFPPLNVGTYDDKLRDLLYVMESHLLLEERWTVEEYKMSEVQAWFHVF